MLKKNRSIITMMLALSFMLTTQAFARAGCKACAGPSGNQSCENVSIGSSWCLELAGGDCHDDLSSCDGTQPGEGG